MLIEELFRSCEIESVAEAALFSIGAATHQNVRDRAHITGLSPGAYVATTLMTFREKGAERDLRAVADVMEHAEQPILAGLHAILNLQLAIG